MRAEILSIGTELLLGQITDTNAVYLAQQLAELGIPLFFKDTVGDNRERLAAVLRIAKERSDLLICTGGLGPTEDDITSAGIADVFAAPLEMNEAAKETLEAFFTRRGRSLTNSQYKQAMLPHGALLVPNPNGTAPGFILEKDGVTVIAFPGPPVEMHPMWEATVAPYLQARSGEIIYSRTLRFSGIGEAQLEEELSELHRRTDRSNNRSVCQAGGGAYSRHRESEDGRRGEKAYCSGGGGNTPLCGQISLRHR